MLHKTCATLSFSFHALLTGSHFLGLTCSHLSEKEAEKQDSLSTPWCNGPLLTLEGSLAQQAALQRVRATCGWHLFFALKRKSTCPQHALPPCGPSPAAAWSCANKSTAYGLLKYWSGGRGSNQRTSEKMTSFPNVWKNKGGVPQESASNNKQSGRMRTLCLDIEFSRLSFANDVVSFALTSVFPPSQPLQASILDLHSGALSMGRQFVNIYRWGGSPCLVCVSFGCLCGTEKKQTLCPASRVKFSKYIFYQNMASVINLDVSPREPSSSGRVSKTTLIHHYLQEGAARTIRHFACSPSLPSGPPPLI